MIVRVVQLYIDGFNDADIEKFRAAFPDARITYTTGDGELVSELISDSLDDWSSGPPATTSTDG